MTGFMALQRYPPALQMVGVAMIHGDEAAGEAQDVDAALKLITAAAEGGYHLAQDMLALMYANQRQILPGPPHRTAMCSRETND